GEKLQTEENPRRRDHQRISQNHEIGIGGRNIDPALLDGEAADEDHEIKVQPRERGEPEGDGECFKNFHGAGGLSGGEGYAGSTTKVLPFAITNVRTPCDRRKK